ncbi:MAG TPA: ABC transporter permease [Candidatus Scatovivens faecipullorum]|nr:ABC transporter permease [Candidatus Scatovivens faecipullorum]
MKAFSTFLKTELKLSFRGIDMFIFAICLPVVILVLIGIINGNNPAFEGADYTFLDQSFGAISTIAICAGGLMGLPLVLSGYREQKILKRLKVTPASPVMLLAVQLIIYMIYSVISLALIFIVAKVFWNFSIKGNILQFLGTYFLVMLSMFSIGLMVGGIAKNSKSAGSIASILYFPMLIFSGATLPYEVMPGIMQKIVDILPLTQGIKILKASTLGLPIDNIIFPIILMILIFVVCIVISVKFFKWE